jgi:hypothetical protein
MGGVRRMNGEMNIGNMKSRDHLVDLGVNGKIILNLILIKPVVKI